MLNVAYHPHVRPKAVLCAFFVGADDWPRLKAALPGWAILATDQKLLTPSASGLLAEVRRLKNVDVNVPIYLAGFSAGVQSVRYLLISNAGAFAEAASLDGAHAKFPEPLDWQIETWQKALERAELGSFSLIMTATSLAYVETLPAPYMSTRHVIERVLSLPADSMKVSNPIERGRAYFRLYDGANKAAHAQQQNNVMPELLAKLWAPLYAAPPAVTPPAVTPAPLADFDPARIVWPDSLSLRWRLLRWMIGELAAKVREEPNGSNTGPRIKDYYTADTYRKGKSLRVGPTAWCLIMISFGLQEVAEKGDKLPPLRVSGIEYENDAKERGDWIDVKDARPGEDFSGYICIADRSTKTGGWERHGTVVATPFGSDGSFMTIGGNEENAVRATLHTLTEPGRVLGFVRLS